MSLYNRLSHCVEFHRTDRQDLARNMTDGNLGLPHCHGKRIYRLSMRGSCSPRAASRYTWYPCTIASMLKVSSRSRSLYVPLFTRVYIRVWLTESPSSAKIVSENCLSTTIWHSTRRGYEVHEIQQLTFNIRNRKREEGVVAQPI